MQHIFLFLHLPFLSLFILRSLVFNTDLSVFFTVACRKKSTVHALSVYISSLSFSCSSWIAMWWVSDPSHRQRLSSADKRKRIFLLTIYLCLFRVCWKKVSYAKCMLYNGVYKNKRAHRTSRSVNYTQREKFWLRVGSTYSYTLVTQKKKLYQKKGEVDILRDKSTSTFGSHSPPATL